VCLCVSVYRENHSYDVAEVISAPVRLDLISTSSYVRDIVTDSWSIE